jgi:Tfp pilus assembly protein PilO
MALTDREKRLVQITLIAAVIGCLLIGYRVISNSLSDTSVSDETANRLETLFVKMNNVDDQKNRNMIIKNNLGNPHGEMVSSSELLKVMTELEELSQRSQVKITTYTPNINTRSKPLAKLEIKLSMECKFEQLIKFLSELKRGKYILQPATIKTSLKDRNKPDLEVQMTVLTYLVDSKPLGKTATSLVTKGSQ